MVEYSRLSINESAALAVPWLQRILQLSFCINVCHLFSFKLILISDTFKNFNIVSRFFCIRIYIDRRRTKQVCVLRTFLIMCNKFKFLNKRYVNSNIIMCGLIYLSNFLLSYQIFFIIF